MSRLARRFALAIAASSLLPASVLAQTNKLGQPVPVPGTPPSLTQPLAERKDVVSWRLLSQVELVKQKNRFVPQFSSNVIALDSKDVKIQGFMVPLEAGEKQSHFVVASLPQSCAFCLPGGPEQFVEVRTKVPVRYSLEPLTLSGKFAVLKDDPTGVFYRIVDASLVN